MLASSSTSVADSARPPGTAGTTPPKQQLGRSVPHLHGRETVVEPDWSATGDNASDVSNPYLYTGRRNDAERNLMQFRQRFYSWKVGRLSAGTRGMWMNRVCMVSIAVLLGAQVEMCNSRWTSNYPGPLPY